ncbi:MAG: hypothetical protein AMXMBFR33_65880 [Candidatus Xenobia bacterium]
MQLANEGFLCHTVCVRRKSGIALVTILLFTPILIIMMVGLYLSVRQSLLVTQGELARTQALYLAEIGLADSMVQLDNDPLWTAGFTNKTVPGTPGSYTVRFNTNAAGPFSPDDSVNNSDGAHPNNFFGPVPSGHIQVVVVARVGPIERKLEALLRMGGSLGDLDLPLLTSGKIKLNGDVLVNGVKSLVDSTSVAGDMHSNLSQASPDLITWTPNGGSALITGKVSSSGTDAGAIDLNGYNPVGGTQTSSAPKAIPPVNILGTIAGKSGASQPVFIPGPNTLATGDWYVPGDVTVNGDLVLDGAKLHVNGTLTVNGSITGEGSVYIAGETHFKGDSNITASSPDKTAIYSNGSVFLTGFDGTAYLNAVAVSDPALGTAWNNVKTSLTDLRTEMVTPGGKTGRNALLDNIRAELGRGGGDNPRPGHSLYQLGTLRARLSAQAPSPSRDFMLRKIQNLESDFDYLMPAQEVTAISAFSNGQVVNGAFDAVFDNNVLGEIPKILSYVDQIDYNRIGNSYFQGILYTHGFVYADNEVTVLGAAVSRDNNTQSTQTIGAQTLDPGDVYFGNRTRLTYVEDFFQGGGGPGSGAMQVVVWMGR